MPLFKVWNEDKVIKKFIVAENFTELASKGKRFCFISFIENTKIGQDTILVAMDVSSLYTNIPQEEGIKIVCKAYETFHNNDPPIPTHYLREMLGLILTENSFEFNKKNYLQTHGVAMGTKTAVSFANIFMAEIETNLILQNNTKPRVWKRYIDDVFSLWDYNRNHRRGQLIPPYNKIHGRNI